MVDYSQFEASVKSGIHADVSRIRQKDEIIKAWCRDTLQHQAGPEAYGRAGTALCGIFPLSTLITWF